MRLSAKQVRAAAMAARHCGLDDAARRLVQANIGGAMSLRAPTWTREGYCALMAWYEGKCAGRTLPGFTAGYWTAQAHTVRPSDALGHRLRQAAAALGWDAATLDAFIAGPHMSRGAALDVASASLYWLTRCLEAVKAMARRAGTGHSALGIRNGAGSREGGP